MNRIVEKKTVLVTGATRGIGEAIALDLGRAGARVVVHYNKNKDRAEKLVSRIGNDSIAIGANLTNQEETKNLFSQAVAITGRVDVLINNAGIALFSSIAASDEDWLDSFHQTIQVNLIHTAYLCKLAINHFSSHGGGIIINIGSRSAFRGETRDYLGYSASKGGLMSLTKSIAKEFGKEGVTAFYLAPGFTRTDMAQDFFDKYGEEPILTSLALKTITEPSDIAPMVTFLASGQAAHATGTTIDLNAGSYMH